MHKNKAQCIGSCLRVTFFVLHLNSDLGEVYGLGIPILSGDDLNNYTSPGNFYSKSTAITGTILNAPDGVSTGFRLEVKANTASDWIKQYIYNNTTVQKIWIRQCDAGKWGNWYSTLTNADIAGRLHFSAGGTAIQSPVVDKTIYRVQINTNGLLRLYQSNDNGVTWVGKTIFDYNAN